MSHHVSVQDLLDLLAGPELGDETEVHIALDLGGSVDSVSFHKIREIHPTEAGGIEIVVYEAFDVLECSDPALESALLGKTHLELCECCLAPLDLL